MNSPYASPLGLELLLWRNTEDLIVFLLRLSTTSVWPVITQAAEDS